MATVEWDVRLAVRTSVRKERQLIWAARLAATWSLGYGLLGLWWAAGGAGFPFGVNDPDAASGMSLFTGVDATRGGAVIAAFGVTGAVIATLLIQRQPTFLRRGFWLFAWIACGALLLLVPDVRMLQALAYSLFLRFDHLNWPVANQFVCLAGGLAWGATALAADSPLSGNNSQEGDAWTTPAAAARWGRWPTAIAVLAPLPYGIVRMAWFHGIPLGVPDTFVAALNQDVATHGGSVLKYVFGSETFVGALLTLGLVQRWGEVFPRWLPIVGNRPVPIWLAVVPASAVAIAVTVAGRAVVGAIVVDDGFDWDTWGLAGPALLWPVWGIALGAATLAYYLRRCDEPRPGDHDGSASIAAGDGRG